MGENIPEGVVKLVEVCRTAQAARQATKQMEAEAARLAAEERSVQWLAQVNQKLVPELLPYHQAFDTQRSLLKIPGMAEIELGWLGDNYTSVWVREYQASWADWYDGPVWSSHEADGLEQALAMASDPDLAGSYERAVRKLQEPKPLDRAQDETQLALRITVTVRVERVGGSLESLNESAFDASGSFSALVKAAQMHAQEMIPETVDEFFDTEIEALEGE